MTFLLLLFVGSVCLLVGLVTGVWLVLWQQGAEKRERFLPDTWKPSETVEGRWV